MYGLIRPFREDTPYYRNVEQILKSNGMKHLKINKNLYICIVSGGPWFKPRLVHKQEAHS